MSVTYKEMYYEVDGLEGGRYDLDDALKQAEALSLSESRSVEVRRIVTELHAVVTVSSHVELAAPASETKPPRVVGSAEAWDIARAGGEVGDSPRDDNPWVAFRGGVSTLDCKEHEEEGDDEGIYVYSRDRWIEYDGEDVKYYVLHEPPVAPASGNGGAR